LGKLAIFSLSYLFHLSPFRADPNRATKGFQKTPMEIALDGIHFSTFEEEEELVALLRDFTKAEQGNTDI